MLPLLRTLLLTLAALALGACVAASESFRPDGRGGPVYRYGAFCGPGHPAFLKEIPTADKSERIARLEALTPTDGLDALCKFHDLCYERDGHDLARCDTAFNSAMSLADLYGGFATASPKQARTALRCARQRAEINAGIAAKSSARATPTDRTPSPGLGDALSYRFSGAGAEGWIGFASPEGGQCVVHNQDQMLECAALAVDDMTDLATPTQSPARALANMRKTRARHAACDLPSPVRAHPLRDPACNAALAPVDLTTARSRTAMLDKIDRVIADYERTAESRARTQEKEEAARAAIWAILNASEAHSAILVQAMDEAVKIGRSPVCRAYLERMGEDLAARGIEPDSAAFWEVEETYELARDVVDPR